MPTFSFSANGPSSRILIVPAVLLATLALAFRPPGAFSECADYGQSFGIASTSGDARRVAVSGSYAFVAAGTVGIQVVDISNPDSPVVVGGLDTPGTAQDVALSGSYAYVTDYPAGLLVIDISSPTSPVIVGTADTPGGASAVTVSGSFAYVADGGSLQIINVSDPASPLVVASVDIFPQAIDVAVSGNHAYVAVSSGGTLSGLSGVQVVDITNPASPISGVRVYTPQIAQTIAVSGSRLYVGYWEFLGFAIMSIENPDAPSVIGGWRNSGDPLGIANVVYDIAISGSMAYAATSRGFFCVDVTTAAGYTRFYDPRISFGTAVSDSYAYATLGTSGLQIFAAPPIGAVGRMTTLASGSGLAISGSYAYVLEQGFTFQQFNFPTGLEVANVSDSRHPKRVGYCPLSGQVRDVSVEGLHAYVANYDLGLQVIDVSNPAAPVVIGTADTPGLASGVAVSGTYAYVADNPSGLQVIDVSNPASPVIVANLAVPSAQKVIISGNYAYVSGSIVDITNPTSPVIVASNGALASSALAISGPYAYVGSGSNVLIIDVSNPLSNPILGSVPTPGSPFDIAVSGNYAYVAEGSFDLQVIDVTNPTSPALLGGTSMPLGSLQVAANNSHVYITQAVSIVRAFVTPPDLEVLPTQCSAGACTTDAGGPYETCGGACVQLDGTLSDVGVNASWSTSGSGTFSPDNTTLDAVYCPSAADVAAGSVTLTLVPESCPSDDVILTISPPVPVVAIDVDPNNLNTNSGAKYVTASIELPPEYDPADVLFESLRLNYTVAASPNSFSIGDWNHNNIPDFTVKFPRDAVQGILPGGDQVPITITGNIGNLCGFTGTDFVRVIRPHLNHPNGGETYLAGARTLVEWENPAGWSVNYAQIHYSADGGDTWTLVEDQVTGQSYVWVVPQEPTQNGRLRVILFDDQGVMGYDSNDGPFTVSTATTGLPETIPTRHRLYQNSPNPFQGATRVAFDLPEAGKVTLKVFDLNGRVVRVLADDWYPAGTHEVPWNALDAGGKPVSAGIYFLHIAAGSFTDTKRMYLQR